jgi:hypothetical protein
MTPEQLNTLLDPGPGVSAGSFRMQVMARIWARRQRREAWRKSAAVLGAAAMLGLFFPAAAALDLPRGLIVAVTLGAGLAFGFAAAGLRRLRIPLGLRF